MIEIIQKGGTGNEKEGRKKKKGKIRNDRAKPRSGQKMKERSGEESSVKVRRRDKKKNKKRRLERLKQGQTERKGRERK